MLHGILTNITNKTTRSALLGSSPFAANYLLNHIKELSQISNITVLTDADANSGPMFKRNGNNAYEAIILVHQEDVTQKEYNIPKAYISNGGTLLLMDSNISMQKRICLKNLAFQKNNSSAM
jgi:hypothetical protein